MRGGLVSAFETVVVSASLTEVRQRLESGLVVVGDVWFPTRREMQVWHQSGASFYVKWTRSQGFEIGPRLETVPAARFAPALLGKLESVGRLQTRVTFRFGFPRFTRWLVGGFVLVNLVWIARVVSDLSLGLTHTGWLGASVVTLLVVVLGSTVAYVWGKGEVRRRMPELLRVLRGEHVVDGEDWG
ncbi:MAG: hypothetical protein ACI9MC_000018 [Kiritimatiellia bacterium]|jgi:hypothetical protein